MKEDKDLQSLALDVFGTLFVKPKKKRLRPLVKQLTYKNKTIKWHEDGQGNFQDFLGKRKISYEFTCKDGETNIEYVKRMIDEEYFD